jgi:hypothetical protein
MDDPRRGNRGSHIPQEVIEELEQLRQERDAAHDVVTAPEAFVAVTYEHVPLQKNVQVLPHDLLDQSISWVCPEKNGQPDYSDVVPRPKLSKVLADAISGHELVKSTFWKSLYNVLKLILRYTIRSIVFLFMFICFGTMFGLLFAPIPAVPVMLQLNPIVQAVTRLIWVFAVIACGGYWARREESSMLELEVEVGEVKMNGTFYFVTFATKQHKLQNNLVNVRKASEKADELTTHPRFVKYTVVVQKVKFLNSDEPLVFDKRPAPVAEGEMDAHGFFNNHIVPHDFSSSGLLAANMDTLISLRRDHSRNVTSVQKSLDPHVVWYCMAKNAEIAMEVKSLQTNLIPSNSP